jgi:HEAT repeat protein
MMPALALALLAAAAPEPACTPPPGAAACAPAPAATAEVREKVRAYLGAIDRPIPPGTWLALGPGAETVLAEVADSDDFPSRRSLALEGLAAFGGPRAEALHRRLAAAGAAPAPVRRAAIRGLARILAADRLPDALRPYLESDPDGSIRTTAAQALATRAPGLACDAVRAQARREGTRGEAMFARALAACAR